jgi:hypothetical protein
MKITIVMPLPGAKLTAQANGHRFSRADAIKSAREQAGWVAMAAINESIDDEDWEHPKEYVIGKATISYAFYLKNNRGQPDEANLIQMCKAYIDGCKDAKLIAEDNWQVLHIAAISVAIDAKNPRVELTFERASYER